MLLELFRDMNTLQIAVLMVSAVLIGINKTALPGIGVLPVILLTLVFPGGTSTGLQLIMLVMADLIAVAWYRRKGDWRIIWRLLPWAWAGVAAGVLTLEFIPPGNDRAMRMIIGGIVLGLAALNFIRARVSPDKIPTGKVAAGCYGTLVGFTSHLANAAGPVAAIYFLAMKLPKQKYMGCNAWFFMILNWTKMPLFIRDGRVTADALPLALSMIPCLLIGGALGILILSKMPQKLFETAIQILVVLCAVKLFF